MFLLVSIKGEWCSMIGKVLKLLKPTCEYLRTPPPPLFVAIFTIELGLLQAWPLNFSCKHHGNWPLKAVSCLLHGKISAGLCFESEWSRLDLSWKRYFMPSVIAAFEIFTFYFSLFSRFINRLLGRVSSISPSYLYFIQQLWYVDV